MDIKPIETIYNGYRFRSRLEARWAVFFDEAGIEYEYEPEGFVLEDGIRYLPDFFLPQLKAYVEIKRKNLNEDELADAEYKCSWLQVLQKDCVVLLCNGDPVDMDITAFYDYWNEMLGFYECSYDSAILVKNASWWKAEVYESGKIHCYTTCSDESAIHIAVGEKDYNNLEEFNQPCLIHRCMIYSCSVLEKERVEARKARFEHGETPKTSR